MKCSLLLVLWLLLSCEQRTPEPIDPLTQTTWCTGSMTYRFGSDGRFEMNNSRSGQRWGGNWSYTQARTDLEINLHSGPNRLIQLIRLQAIHCTNTMLTARWTDEIAHAIPTRCQVCQLDAELLFNPVQTATADSPNSQ